MGRKNSWFLVSLILGINQLTAVKVIQFREKYWLIEDRASKKTLFVAKERIYIANQETRI